MIWFGVFLTLLSSSSSPNFRSPKKPIKKIGAGGDRRKRWQFWKTLGRFLPSKLPPLLDDVRFASLFFALQPHIVPYDAQRHVSLEAGA